MDVTPQTLREVEFREKMRGYHPEDVDAFLERVADGIEVLQERLRQAMERAARAEQQAAEAGGNDETLRKTLLLAQRTADLAVQEAREQASRILAGAEQQAQGMLGDAEERARQAEKDAQATLRADVTRLETARDQLQRDVDALTKWLDEQKGHLGAALDEAMGRIRRLGTVGEPPAVTDVDVPSPSVPRPRPSSSGPAAGPEARASAASPQREPAELAGVGARNGGAAVVAPSEPALDLSGGRRSDSAVVPQPAPAPREDAVPEEPATAGTRAGGDPFLAELRRAVDERGPLGPREAPRAEAAAQPDRTGGLHGLYDQSEDDERPSGGRLWRRR